MWRNPFLYISFISFVSALIIWVVARIFRLHQTQFAKVYELMAALGGDIEKLAAQDEDISLEFHELYTDLHQKIISQRRAFTGPIIVPNSNQVN